jgi:hypothetical protein
MLALTFFVPRGIFPRMDNIRIVHPTLDGVTTAVVLFLFACLVVPDFI